MTLDVLADKLGVNGGVMVWGSRQSTIVTIVIPASASISADIFVTFFVH